MGSFSMPVQTNAQASSRGERLSAFVDGELFDGEHPNTILAAFDHEDRADWACYHLIGDAMRSDDLAVSPAASSAFLSGFSARFESEAHVLAPASIPVTRRLLALRRRVVPAFAVAAAAATLTWIVMPQLQGVNPAASVAQVASVGSHPDSVQRVAMASMPVATVAQANPQDGNIIRDANLDQYLEAHQQFGLQPVVSSSASLIRAASLNTQGQ
jgi:sigma-E factor negative regulatory protein RseA